MGESSLALTIDPEHGIAPSSQSFTVYGTPQPQGSARSFIPKGWKRAVITTDNKKLKPWRQEVSGSVLEAMSRGDAVVIPSCAAFRIFVTFYFAKPKSTPKRVTHKTTKPDTDKLLRGIFDALTGIVWVDDSQIVEVNGVKLFGLPERAEIVITELL